MRPLTTLVLIALCFTLVGSASAQRSITVTPIDDSAFQAAGVGPAKAACQVGNLNTPMSILSGWFTGDESYTYLFNPAEQACDCPAGFELTGVTMFLNFPDTATYPVDFNMYVGMDEALLPEPGCWTPGPELCVGDVFAVSIPAAGNYFINIPITCECAFMDYYYFLSVHYIGIVDANIIVDDVPLACTAYNDWGSGWVDLYTQGFDAFGMPVIHGDVECCATPVPSANSSWGKVKQLYR